MKESKEITQSNIMTAMDWAYDKAVNGFGILDSAEELAIDYLRGDSSLRDKANSLIRWQNSKAATSGFVTGLGGLLTMPITLPVNITSVLFVQIRMIAAIAYMGGYDLKDDRVKSLVYICLTASSAAEVVKQIGITVGNKLALNAVKKIPASALIAINQKVSFRLFTKFGDKGVINLGKAVPLVGGVIGALFDILSTNKIGNVARDTFLPE